MGMTRRQQRTDTIYRIVDGGYGEPWFISPDGEGRVWYESKADLIEDWPEAASYKIQYLYDEPEDY